MTDTHATHREIELLDTLRNFGGSARTANLAKALNVSEETIRRTVKSLAKADLVQRVHGGVYLANAEAESTVHTRLAKRTIEKSRVAAAAAAQIPDGATVFLDVGSTTAYVAEKLADHKKLTVVTNGLHAALALVGYTDIHVYLAGGRLLPVETGAFGAEAMAYVSQFNIDVAVLSVDAIDLQGGFLLAGADEAELARTVISRTKRTIIVADHGKFGRTAPMVVCNPLSIDTLITDEPVSPAFARRCTDWGVEVMVAGKGPAL